MKVSYADALNAIDKIGSNMSQLNLQGNRILISYKTPVAYQDKSGKFFKTDKKWSNTTSKHITKWLAGSPATEVPQSFLDNLVS
jgi:hypothetical protein